MKKTQIALLIVVILGAFGAADFYLNNLGGNVSLNLRPDTSVQAETAAPQPIPVDSVFKDQEVIEGFTVTRQSNAGQIFDKIDLTNIKNIKIAKSILQKGEPPEPLIIFQIRGPIAQGSLTYLSVKLQFIAQINATTETLNEDGKSGDNSFWFNDLKNTSTAFLLTQIGDNLYGFQYSKKSAETFASIQKIIGLLTSRK